MKKVIIQFEFPNDYDHEEIVGTINGAISDIDNDLATEMTYTIVGRN